MDQEVTNDLDIPSCKGYFVKAAKWKRDGAKGVGLLFEFVDFDDNVHRVGLMMDRKFVRKLRRDIRQAVRHAINLEA
jgi:hypothetical protein